MLALLRTDCQGVSLHYNKVHLSAIPSRTPANPSHPCFNRACSDKLENRAIEGVESGRALIFNEYRSNSCADALPIK